MHWSYVLHFCEVWEMFFVKSHSDLDPALVIVILHVGGLVQEPWSNIFLALTHRCVIVL